MQHKKTLANIFQWKTTVTWPNCHWFFRFLGVICHFIINIRIEVHFFLFALGNKRTLVTCKSCEALLVACKSLRSVLHFALHKIYMWPVSFHFFMQTKKVLQSLIKGSKIYCVIKYGLSNQKRFYQLLQLPFIFLAPSVLQKMKMALGNENLTQEVVEQYLICLKEEWMKYVHNKI